MSDLNSHAERDGQQFVVRLLDRAAVNAWLPAALIAASAVYLLYARAVGTTDPMMVSHAVVETDWQSLVLFAPLAIVSAVLVESSTAAMLGILQGQWGTSRATSYLTRLFVRWERGKMDRLRRRASQQRLEAFHAMQGRLAESGLAAEQVNFLAANVSNLPYTGNLSEEGMRQAATFPWRSLLQPGDANLLDSLSLRTLEYPPIGVIQPTKLGNILAATEERLRNRSDYDGSMSDQAAALPVSAAYLRLTDRLELLTGFLVASLVVAFLAVTFTSADQITSGPAPIRIAVGSCVVAWISHRSMIATGRTMLRLA